MYTVKALMPLLLGSVLVMGCASAPAPQTQTAQAAPALKPLGYTPAADFEGLPLNVKPQGFDVGGPVVVTDEQARSGTQAIKMTRTNSGENVRLRHHFGATPKGALRFSLYVPSNASADTFVTLFQDSYRADPDRIIDVIFRANGEIRNREANGPVPVGRFERNAWNDVEIIWTHMETSGGYSLVINGNLIGHFRAERAGMVPARMDFKYGSGNAPTGAASIYLDAITILE